MKKLLSIILCLAITLTLGLACSCSAPNSTTPPPNDNPSNPPAVNSGITESQWESVLENSSIDNVTVLEGVTTPSQTATENTEYSIDGNKIHVVYSGVRHEDITDAQRVASLKKLHGFYQNVVFDKMTFNADKNTYSVSGEISVTDGENTYTFTDITIKVNTKIYVIDKITATRTLGDDVIYINNAYTLFGTTSAS